MNHQTQPRVAPGRPEGGEWAARNRPEANLTLSGNGFGASALERQRRRDALETAGYVPAHAWAGADEPLAVDQWWSRAYAAAEHTPDGQGFPKLTDDYAVAGHSTGRRIRRMTYRGAGVKLVMPSASLIRAFSRDHDHGTFDIPVEGSYPGGTVHGWLRVTQNAPGIWSVQGLGMTDQAAAYVAEAAAAVLEARTSRTALAETRDLLARRRARFAAGGVKLTRTEVSSFISGVGYNHAAQVMTVRIGSRHYAYRVSSETYQVVLNAHSPGAAYNALVKGSARDMDVTSCDACFRFYAAGTAHRCPSRHKEAPAGVQQSNLRARELARA